MAGNGFQSGINFGILQGINQMDPIKTELAAHPLPNYTAEGIRANAEAQQAQNQAYNVANEGFLNRVRMQTAQQEQQRLNAMAPLEQQAKLAEIQKQQLANQYAQATNPYLIQNQQLANQNLRAQSNWYNSMAQNGQGGANMIWGIDAKGRPYGRPIPQTVQERNALNQADTQQKYNQAVAEYQKNPTAANKQMMEYYQTKYTALQNVNLKPTAEIQNAKAMNEGVNQAPVTIQGKQYTPTQMSINAKQFPVDKNSMLSASDQKQFTTNTQILSNLTESQNTLADISAQMDSMAKGKMGPITGAVSAKFNEQGQALQKNLNQLVLQAPTLFGLPASALRNTSIWKMIEATKPAPGMWWNSAHAMVQELQAAADVRAEAVWKQNAQMAQQQLLSPSLAVQQKAELWAKQNPEPLARYRDPQTGKINVPDVSGLTAMFPAMKNVDFYKDLKGDSNYVIGAPIQTETPTQYSPQAVQPQPSATQTIDGVTYEQHDGKWYTK